MYCLRGIQNVLTSHSVDLSPGKVNKINTYCTRKVSSVSLSSEI